MHKTVFVAFVVLATMQIFPTTTDAFIVKTISIQKGYPASLPTVPSPDAAVAALTASKNALVQTVANAVTDKINTITSLVGSIVQSKIEAKNNLLRSAINAKAGIVKSVNGILVSKPVFTKTVSFGFKPLYITTTTQPVPTTITSATTTTGGAITTTSGGYARSVRYIRRN